MALVIFLRGVNVGGYRRIRPSVLAKQLRAFDVVNVGAAGTFVVRKPGPQALFCAELQRRLPFETEVVCCDAREVIRLETENPFEDTASNPDIVRFVSVVSKASPRSTSFPYRLPPTGEWLVQLIGSEKQFIFGMYRRHMKTIGYLGQMDKLLGARATTRNWNTILAVVRILKNDGTKAKRG